jgi:hypothetical protein
MADKSIPQRAKDAFGWDVSPMDGEDGFNVDFHDERGVMQLDPLELEHWLDHHDEAKAEAERPWWKLR